MFGKVILTCCSGIFLHLTAVQGYSWGRDKTTCIPVNLLCAYSEECCAGVCIQRVFFRILKIKLCTVNKKYLLSLNENQQSNVSSKLNKNASRLREGFQPMSSPIKNVLEQPRISSALSNQKYNSETKNKLYNNESILKDKESRALSDDSMSKTPEPKEKKHYFKYRKKLTYFLRTLWEKIKINLYKLKK